MNELADHGLSDDKGPTQKDAEQVLLSRRSFFNDMPDRGLFALVTVIGFCIIFWLKKESYNSDVIALLAVAVMIGYGVIAYNMTSVRLRPDRLGDNFYYLGFIFTLSSLSAALFQLRDGTDINSLLGNFGIALITTIVGIAGRVLFLQMRGELDEIEERARQELAETSSRLRSQLMLSIREFEVLRVAVSQSLSESAESQKEFSDNQRKLLEDLSKNTKSVVEDVVESNRTQIQRLNETVQTLSEKVKNVAEHTENIRFPSDKLEADFQSFADKLEAVLVRINSIVASMAKVSRSRRWYWPFKKL